MSLEVIGGLGFVVLFALIFGFGMPIGFAMGLVGFAGITIIGGWNAALGSMATIPYTTGTNYIMAVIPMFVLMGEFAFVSGIVTDFFTAVNKWIGNIKGGMAMATIAGCAGFAACTGSSSACATVMVPTAWTEMKRFGYSPSLGLGTIAAGGTLGMLIPPSLSFVVYAMIAEQSVGKLLIAGILPGFLLAGLMMVTIYFQVKLNPSLAPGTAPATWHERWGNIGGLWPMMFLGIVIMGTIWGGVLTPEEAGAFGALIAFLMAVIRKKFTRENLKQCFLNTARTTAMVFTIMIGATIFSAFVTITKLPFALADLMISLDVSYYVMIVIIFVVYVILGSLMDPLGMVLLTVPIMLPTLTTLGFDLIWYGVFITIMTEMALITPPIGVNVFVVSGMVPSIPMYNIFKGIVPFIITMTVCLALLVIFPQIVTFLPDLMR